MKYSEASLNLAIETILPHIKTAKDAGANIELSRPQLLKDVAVEYFTTATPFNHEKMLCLSVARQSLKELSQKGQIDFGEAELSDEIDIHYQQLANMSRPDALN